MNFLIVLALVGLMHAARTFDSGGSHATTLAFGFVLLAAFFTGRIFANLRLPKLTGYIATGILVGPAVLGLLSPEMVHDLEIVDGVAIAMIALTAGNELDLRAFRPLLRSIQWITLWAVVGTALLLGVAVFAMQGLLPFLSELSLVPALAVAVVMGVVMSAQSPAVVVALRDEVEADGPMSRTVLGVVVIADLVVILLFAATSSLAQSVVGSPGELSDTLSLLTWEILGSLTSGVLVGSIIAAYLRFVGRNAALFVVAVCFVVAEVGSRIHFDPLLVALAAGVLIRNTTRQGDLLHSQIEMASLPVYVVFFAVAGAHIDLRLLASVALPATAIVVVRGIGLVFGSRIGAHFARSPETVRRWAGFGLLPQAGLALALAALFVKTFPGFGAEARALVLGVVALNELVAPAIYRWALVRSGEAGQREVAETADRPAEQPAA